MSIRVRTSTKIYTNILGRFNYALGGFAPTFALTFFKAEEFTPGFVPEFAPTSWDDLTAHWGSAPGFAPIFFRPNNLTRVRTRIYTNICTNIFEAK